MQHHNTEKWHRPTPNLHLIAENNSAAAAATASTAVMLVAAVAAAFRLPPLLPPPLAMGPVVLLQLPHVNVGGAGLVL